MKKKTCCDCGKMLKKDEVALSQKLIDLEIDLEVDLAAKFSFLFQHLTFSVPFS